MQHLLAQTCLHRGLYCVQVDIAVDPLDGTTLVSQVRSTQSPLKPSLQHLASICPDLLLGRDLKQGALACQPWLKIRFPKQSADL